MRVAAKTVDWQHCPPELAPYTKRSQTFLTAGREYKVHAQRFSLDSRVFRLSMTWVDRPGILAGYSIVDCSIQMTGYVTS